MTHSLKIVRVPRIAALADRDNVVSVRTRHHHAISFNAERFVRPLYADRAQRIASDDELSVPLPPGCVVDLAQRIICSDLVVAFPIR